MNMYIYGYGYALAIWDGIHIESAYTEKYLSCSNITILRIVKHTTN